MKQQAQSKEGLVQQAVARLRTMILDKDAGAHIGALPEIAKNLGVGMVTVQQAARLLEHEGFLKVRRGNRGGYYGARPDAVALSRAMASFLTVGDSSPHEAVEIMTLLECDLVAKAALVRDENLRAQLRAHAKTIDTCDKPEQLTAFEQRMHDILYTMVRRPLTAVLARVTMQFHVETAKYPIYAGADGLERWKQERHNVIAAILRGDPGLARFEAQRRHEDILRRIEEMTTKG